MDSIILNIRLKRDTISLNPT